MRRVLMTVDAVGGVWTYATSLARGLVEHGYETLLAVLGPAPSDARRADAAGAAIIETGLPLDWAANDRAASLDAARRLARLAADEGCAIVHLNSPLLAASADWPAPALTMAHGCLATWWAATRELPLDSVYDWQRDLTAQGLRAAAVVAAPSAALAQALRRAYGLTRAIAVVHNGCDPQPVPDAAPRGARSFAFTAGRLWDEAKGSALLDAAAALIAGDFLAAGAIQGPHGERFTPRHLDARGELPARDVAAILARRPVFVSAARFEPFGLAVLEAAAAGCPLVLADIATFRELWDGAAVFVPEPTARAYADAVNRLLADAEARRVWGARARDRAARYSVAAMARGTARLYAEALAESVAA